MSKTKADKSSKPDTDMNTETDAIIEYLRDHPEFFSEHPEVLADINLTHECNGAVSLIEHQVKALRSQNLKLKRQLDDLIAIARDNDNLNDRIHRLTLSLMDAETINEAYIALDDTLRGEFMADAVAVKLFVDLDTVEIEPDNELMQTIFVHMNDPSMDDYKSLLTRDEPICGPMKPEQLDYIFGLGNNFDPESIKSTALIPLGGDRCSSLSCDFLGILAIGSQDPRRFYAGMGTMFLSNLGDIVSRTVRGHLIPKLGE